MTSIGRFFGHVAAAVAVTTVGALPWMLGGVVPLARCTLLAGAIVAGMLSVMAHLARRRLPRTVPWIVAPLAALTVLGLWQLRAADTFPAAVMSHAISDVAFEPGTTAAQGTVAPADTRSAVGTLVALILLATVGFAHIRTPVVVTVSSFVLILNGMAIAVVGLSHQFRETSFSLNSLWVLGAREPFGPFVNPNSAAGWLCLCFGLAAGWMSYHSDAAAGRGNFLPGNTPVAVLVRWYEAGMRLLADFTPVQAFAFMSVAFLGGSVAATSSRGGILALSLAVVITLVAKSSLRRLPLILFVLIAFVASIYGFLTWMDLDRNVVREVESLKDISKAAGSRPAHWLDSLRVVFDFPLSGTGLGGYRFATLPYQSRYTYQWFRNADNQYVEMLVEGGLMGLLFFVVTGLTGVVTGMACWRYASSRTEVEKKSRSRIKIKNKASEDGATERLIAAAGTGVMIATLSQAVSGFFDFGVGIPAAAALLVLIISVAAGVVDDVEPVVRNETLSGAVTCGRVALLVQVCLICAGAALFADQAFAAVIDLSVVSGHAHVTRPRTPEKLDLIGDERLLLLQRLQKRPDDPEGLRMLSRLADAQFRWSVLLAADGDSIREVGDFDAAWRQMTVLQLVSQLTELEARDSQAAIAARLQMAALLDQSTLPQTLERVQAAHPLMPSIAQARAEIAALTGDIDLFQQQLHRAMFAEPSDAEMMFHLGILSLQLNLPDETRQLWQFSRKLSVDFQAGILSESRRHWSQTESLDLFGPDSYAECVQTAAMSTDTEIRSALFDRAEAMWLQKTVPTDGTADVFRATHLARTDRQDEAIAWLQDRVSESGDRTLLRQKLARLLEEQGRFLEALDAWYAIKAMDPGNTEADKAIESLQER